MRHLDSFFDKNVNVGWVGGDTGEPIVEQLPPLLMISWWMHGVVGRPHRTSAFDVSHKVSVNSSSPHAVTIMLRKREKCLSRTYLLS